MVTSYVFRNYYGSVPNVRNLYTTGTLKAAMDCTMKIIQKYKVFFAKNDKNDMTNL